MDIGLPRTASNTDHTAQHDDRNHRTTTKASSIFQRFRHRISITKVPFKHTPRDRTSSEVPIKHTPLTNSSSDTLFKHTPLTDASKEIRLFELDGGRWDDTPKLRLHSYRWFNCPGYTAISYVWGDPGACRRVTVNGLSLNVTANAHYALQQIWHQHKKHMTDKKFDKENRSMKTTFARHFWMDTICIDQNDLSEKAMQVQLMGDTYEGAGHVFACVGPHKDHSELVTEVFGSVGGGSQVGEEDTLENRLLEQLLKRCKVQPTFDQLAQAFYAEFSEAALKFCNREYWRRMWIVQETRLAKFIYLYCGYEVISLKRLMPYISALPSGTPRSGWLGRWSESSMAAVLKHSRHSTRGIGKPQMDADVAFRNLYNNECSDFRDRVYALLRILEWGSFTGKVNIRPNYELTKVGLMNQVADALLESDVGPNIASRILGSLCGTLRLTVDDPEILEMLTARQHSCDEQDYAEGETEPLSSTRRMVGQFSALNFRLQSCQNGLRMENCGTREGNDCRVFEEMVLHESRYQPLSIDGTHIGWTCGAVQPDDYLVAKYLVGEMAKAPGIPCLVVRKGQGHRFRMIGHALLKREVYPLGKSPWFKLWFDLEDYITIVAIRSSKITDDAISAGRYQLLDSSPTRTRYSSFAEMSR